MINKYIKGRVLVCIDTANLECSLKDLQWHMDYRKLYDYFSKTTNLYAIRFYCVHLDSESQNKFFTVLKKINFKLVTKKMKVIKNGNTIINKANFDVEITYDALELRKKYDNLVLFSGDSDFEYLINKLRGYKKSIIVVSTRHHISKELIYCCKKYIDLKKLRNEFERIT
jgi:uncharacterized LabA/DUF88 family protein